MNNHKRIDPKELNVNVDELNDINIHSDLNIEQLIFRQIERTHQAATQDETVFAVNVRILMNMIPAHRYDDIVNRTDEYTSVVERWEYKHFCGVPLGTPAEPVCGSPYKVNEEVLLVPFPFRVSKILLIVFIVRVFSIIPSPQSLSETAIESHNLEWLCTKSLVIRTRSSGVPCIIGKNPGFSHKSLECRMALIVRSRCFLDFVFRNISRLV
jgi:hypothetical protein